MKFLISLILVGAVSYGYAQNNVLKFTDYTTAQPLINPAAMGLESGANGVMLYRSRFEKSTYWPSTGAFNINTSIPDKNFGGGLSLIFDKFGPYQKLFAYLSGTYRLKVNEGKCLHFGLQAGVNYVSNSNEYILADDETIFAESYSQPNFGFGLHFKADNYFVGASIPEFRYNTVDENGDRVSETMSEMMRIYLYGGFKFKLGTTTELMPYTYITYCEYEDMLMDLGAKLTLKESFEVGVQYRTKESFAVTARVKLLKEIWLGYSFETNNSQVDSKFNTTQELSLTFRFGKSQKSSSSLPEEEYDESINSIRYF